MTRPTPGTLVAICAGAVALGWAVWKVADALRSDETRVRLVLEDAVRSARERDAGALLEYVDPDYRDSAGYTRREVEFGVRYLFDRARSVEAEASPLSIRVEGDRAFALVRARAELRIAGGVVRLADAGFGGDTFQLELRRHGSYFRVVSVREAREGSEER